MLNHTVIRFLLQIIVNINLNVNAVLGNMGDLTFSQALDSLLASKDNRCGQRKPIRPLLSSFS